jgi:membrane protein DedA with SNARE-associated domain
MNVNHLLVTYGDAAVFALVLAECLGVPLPGETILIAASIYSGATHKLSIFGIFAVASVAAILGDNIGFWIGDKGGYRLLRRYGNRVRLDPAKIKVGRLVFDRYGPKVVFFGRFVSILRTYAAFLAGTLKMTWRKFLPFNAAGGIVWAALYSFVPYSLGSAVHKLSTAVSVVFGVAAVLALVAGFLAIRHKTVQLVEAAEIAFPGPLPER